VPATPGKGLILHSLDSFFHLESGLACSFSSLAQGASSNPEAAGLLTGLATLAVAHSEAVTSRIGQLGGEVPAAVPSQPPQAESPSAALRVAFGLAGDAAIAYSMFQPLTSRFRDSAISAPEGTSGHLARAHTQDYVAAQGKIASLLHAAVLRELADAGEECLCTCPACGLGTCACGIGALAALGEAWLAARPVAEPARYGIPKPRRGSAADQAGLQEGDCIATVDDVALESYPQLQTAIKAHEPGTAIPFTVQREGQSRRVIVRRIADLEDGPLPLDCEAPSGEAFYLDRARDLQRRLRNRASTGSGPVTLARLSVRETQVLRLVTNGATNPMIAEKLRVSRPTVARHIANILVKLEVTNRTEAAGIAASAGLASDTR